jgi:hypothetical protein
MHLSGPDVLESTGGERAHANQVRTGELVVMWRLEVENQWIV